MLAPVERPAGEFTDFTDDDSDYEPVSQITGGVYQSGFINAIPPHIDAVVSLCLHSEMRLNCRESLYPLPWNTHVKDYLWRPLDDNPARPPDARWLHETAGIVQSWRQSGRTVLVHCAVGLSRSTTVTAAYLMRRYEWSDAEALAFIAVARPGAKPNFGLRKLLVEYHQKLLVNSAFPPDGWRVQRLATPDCEDGKRAA